MSEIALDLKAHCLYLNEILGDNDRKEIKSKGILELTKLLDAEELYFHVQGNMLWRIGFWKKDQERVEEIKKREAEANAKLDARKQAFYTIAKGVQQKFVGLELNLVYKLTESIVNDNNYGAAFYFTDGKLKLEDVPKLPFPKYENLDTGIKLTS
jgi:hypothetical protein